MTEHLEVKPPLADRTLVHGRNTMAIAGVILVLAWLPGIEITKFEPFGFKFDVGSEISAWFLLFVAMIYYAARFYKDCHTDLSAWVSEMIRYEDFGKNSQQYLHALRLRARAWRWDITPPFILSVLATIAAVFEILSLLRQ